MLQKGTFKILVKNHLETINISHFIVRISKKERFDLRFSNNLDLKKQFILDVIEYLTFRQNASQFASTTEQELLQMQHKVQKQLENSSCNSIEGLHHHSKMFIEKMVLFSLLLSKICDQLPMKHLHFYEPRETFIILIFLSSGKFVSAKSFDLAKERMRKKMGSSDSLPTYTTIKSLKQSKQTKRSQKDQYPSEFSTFMDDVRIALYGQKPQRTKKQNKNKNLFRKCRTRIQSKAKFPNKNQNLLPLNENRAPFKENTVSFKEDLTEDLDKSRKKSKFLSIFSRGRVSLDKNLISQLINFTQANKIEKSQTNIAKYRKLSKIDSNAKSQAVIRASSLKQPSYSTHLKPSYSNYLKP